MPPEVIDEIRNRLDLVRVVGEVVPLKKSGRNYLGLCPFHSEKTPSFTVSEQKQLDHCFGCGEGGTLFTFMMRFHHLSFPETLERCAARAGVDLSRYRQESDAITKRKELQRKMHKVLAYAGDFYHHIFLRGSEGAGARRYATGRGISTDAAQALKLGFAPSQWQTLTQSLIKDGYSLEDAHQAGLISKSQKDDGYFDLFRDRLLFPITDPKGNPVGFGGRILGDGTPKYLNSPQSPVFDKGRLLYGLFEAEGAIRERKRAILVEGYMDQAALRFAEFPNTVATLGTALTDDHARLLTKYTENVVVLFDGDEAGLKAARRSMKALLSHGLRAKVTILPKGEDPDTFVRKSGRKEFETLMEASQPMLDFFIDRFFRGEGDVTEKARAVEELAELIRGTENAYLREAILDEVARKTELDKGVLRGEPGAKNAFRPGLAQSAANPPKPLAESPEFWTLLRIAAEVPEARAEILAPDILGLLGNESLVDRARRWLEEVGETAEDSESAPKWVDRWEDEATKRFLVEVFMKPGFAPNTWKKVLSDCTYKLRQGEIRRLLDASAEARQRGADEEASRLGNQMFELKKKLDQRSPG
ncbi:MAG: DNA primase [Pseudomonadota bacterium]